MSEAVLTMTGSELADLIRRMGKLKDQYFTVKEAAAYMRQRASTIRGWIAQGLIYASNPTGGKLLVRKRDLDGLWKTHIVDYAEPSELHELRSRAAKEAQAARKAKAAARKAAAAADAQEPWMPATGEDLEQQTLENQA